MTISGNVIRFPLERVRRPERRTPRRPPIELWIEAERAWAACWWAWAGDLCHAWSTALRAPR